MRFMRFVVWFMPFMVGLSIVTAQQCTDVVQRAIETTSQGCDGATRNEACYGHSSLIVESFAEEISFENEGDITSIFDIATLQTTPFDEATGTWGIALLRLQASLPDTVPGQNVTVLVLGDVTMENAVEPIGTIPITTNASVRVRSTPSTANDTNILEALPVGTTVTAIGRTEDGEWLRFKMSDYDSSYGAQTAWVAAFLVDGDSERMSLPVVVPDDIVLNSMQAFYLQTGIGDYKCNDLPPDGILIQSPQHTPAVLTINQTEVALGSTLFVQIESDSMLVAVLEGRGMVSNSDGAQFVPAGTYTTIPLTDDGRSPVGSPTVPQPYDASRLALLMPTVTGLPDPITVSDPLPEEDIPAAIDAVLSEGGVDGTYRFEYQNGITYVNNMPERTACTSFTDSYLIPITFGEDEMIRRGESYPMVAPGVYGALPSAHAAYHTEISDNPDGEMVQTYKVISPTQIQQNTSWHFGGQTEIRGVVSDWRLACEQIWIGTRIG